MATATGDELRLLRDDREITTTRRRIALGLTALVGAGVSINGLAAASQGTAVALAGGVVGTVIVSGAVYWLLLRSLSAPRTSDRCPQCGDEHLVKPMAGVAAEPDGPYCPEPTCGWTADEEQP